MKKSYLVFYLLLVCSLFFGNEVYAFQAKYSMRNGTGTLRIDRASLPQDREGFSADAVELTTSTGEKIPFVGNINYSQTDYVHFRPGRMNGAFTTEPLPGIITKITVKLPDTGNFPEANWAIGVSSTGPVSVNFGHDKLEAKPLNNAGDIISWDVDPEKAYTYFSLEPTIITPRSDAYFEYVIVEYKVSVPSGNFIIDRASLPQDREGFSADAVELTTSTGEKIPFVGNINYSQTDYVHFRPGRMNGAFTTEPLPGIITKITVKLPDTGNFPEANWAIGVSSTGPVSTNFGHDKLEAKPLNNAGDIISWDVDPEKAYTYFSLEPTIITPRSDAYFEYVRVEYMPVDINLPSPVVAEPTDITCASFVANWTEVTNAASYLVYVEQVNGEEKAQIEGSPFSSEADSLLIEGLSAETNYSYYIVAVAGDLQSQPSDSMSVTTPACPPSWIVTLNERGITKTIEGSTIVLPASFPTPSCILEGWSFSGWSKSTDIVVNELIPAGEYTLTENITLYAVYEKNGNYTLDPSCQPMALLEIPYRQNFDEVTEPALPEGWIVYDINGDTDTWRTAIDIPGTMANVSYSKPNSLLVGYSYNGVSGTTSIDDWAFSPMISLEAGESYKVSFYVRITSSYANYKLKVFLANAQHPDYVQGEALVDTVLTGSDAVGYNLIEYKFTVSETGGYSIGIWGGADSFVYAMNIDDFVIESGILPVKIDKVTPVNGEIDIPVDNEVYAEFNQDISGKVLDLNLITIPGATGVEASVEENRLIIKHDPFPYLQKMTVNIPEGAIDNFEGAYWEFTTVSSEVILYEYYPQKSTTGVWLDSDILLVFNKEVTVSDISKITINDVSGITSRVEGKHLYIDHDNFERDKTYTINIEEGAILDYAGISWSFSTVKSGNIPDETHLYGPIGPMFAIRGVSENGRYITGQSGGYGPFMWDLLEENKFFPLRQDGLGSGFHVSNNGLTVGQLSGSDASGLYWFEGKMRNLPPYKGIVANAVSADGRVIAGYSTVEDPEDASKTINVPYSWTLQEDGTWLGEKWACPEGTTQAVIIDISSDGKMAVGRISLKGSGVLFRAIYWKSKDEYVLPYGDRDVPSNYMCVSGNGKYAGLRTGGVAAIHDMEADKITTFPVGDYVNAVTNDGLAVGVIGTVETGMEAYVYSAKLGYMTFTEYVERYFSHLDKNIYDKMIEIAGGNSRIMDVSPDGKNWTLQSYNTITRIQEGFMLHLKDGLVEAKPRPTGLTAELSREDRKVTLSWIAPATTETVLNYKIYADNTLQETVNGETTTYIDGKAPFGDIAYSVSAVYADAESPRSDVVKVLIADNYNIPFKEDFNVDLKTNFWTVEGMQARIEIGAGVKETVGLNAFVPSNPDVNFSGRLISKPLDARGKEKVYLSYMMLAYYLEWNTPAFTDDDFYVEVTTDGENWTVVDHYQPERFNDWRAEILDISEQVAGELFNFRFRIEGVNNLSTGKYWFFDNITVDVESPNGDKIPGEMIYKINEEKDSVKMIWQDPSGLYGLTHSTTSANTSFGNLGKPFIIAHKFDKDELDIYNGLSLQSISAFITKESTNSEFRLAVFANGERIDNTPVTEFTADLLNTFVLEKPITVTADMDELLIGLEIVKHGSKEQPVAGDEPYRVVKGKGDIFSEDNGATWKNLSDIMMEEEFMTQRNWCIFGNLSQEENKADRTPYIVGYNIYHEGEKLNTDLQYRSVFTVPYVEGNYTLRSFSMDGEEISAESASKMVSTNSVESETADIKVTIYPNPAREVVNISGEFNEVGIYDLQGKKLLDIRTGDNQIFVGSLNNGVYLIKIKTDNGEHTEKLIINK